jgi:ATP-dependent Clp protease ATP-binding subunit ClpC
MFERYTEKARRVIFFGRWEASQFGSPYIESEHLLLGLLREDQGILKRIERSGASVESIRKQIEAQTPALEKVSSSVDLPLSQKCKRVLAYAAEEAERLSHKHIGTEHLLLGLLREEKSLAAKILQERGLRLERLRFEIPRGELKATEPTRVASTSPLSVVSRDLIEAASADELDPLIGREKELDRVIQVLCRRTRNNPVLVGEPGVGKTAIVYGLAQRIASGDAPPRLEAKRLLALDLSLLVAVAGGRQLEERAMAVPKELMEAANLIVLVEDLFTKAGAQDLLKTPNLLKPLLTQGELQCIAAATPGDYRKAIEEEAWLEACFSPVEVRPPDAAEALKMLVGIKPRYENFHGVLYTDEALQYAVYHSERYMPGRCLPEKAIDLIDEAGAAVAAHGRPADVIDVEKRIKFVVNRMENAIANHEFEKARFYSDEERKEREHLRQLREKYNVPATGTVTLDDIEYVVARWTGVPIDKIRQERGSTGPGGPGGEAA